MPYIKISIRLLMKNNFHFPHIPCYKLFFILVATLCFQFCKPAPPPEVIVKEEVKEPEPKLGDCYLAISGNDSILMQLVIENKTVVGQLHYRFAEKDKSGGTLFGDM